MLVRSLLVVVLGGTFFLPNLAFAGQEGKEANKATEVKKAEKPKTRLRGRVPRYFGQLGLSREQRQEIYRIQAKYRSQIAELQAQIAALRKAERQEIEGVLTEGQKARLEEIIRDRAGRRAAKKPAKKDPTLKPPDKK